MPQLMHGDERRCFDEQCPNCQTCLRYLARLDDLASLSAKSLRKWQTLDGSCRWYIEAPKEPQLLTVPTMVSMPEFSREPHRCDDYTIAVRAD